MVYTSKARDIGMETMNNWCKANCEGLFMHMFVSWYLEAWGFTDAEDACQFSLTWQDYVYNNSTEVT